jgi:hypothetical protein
MTTSPNASDPEPQPGGSARRRNPPSWMLFRIVLGLSGAALVLFPVVGLVMFIAAILFLPARPRTTLNEKARELGALVVVDGGRYCLPDSASSVPVQLFVAADRISALDAKFRALVEIPTAEITSFLALRAGKGWFLEVIWTSHAAEFAYRGVSAERLAHVAESAIRSVTPAAAPALPQRRAAGA